ncbi:MAG: SEC-C metal-binding domain-containing protein [Oscillospiraceae bacterium]|nr:SEC-C metal-binding domain-containing protein [Oscillospiraceae bacterium]
MADMGKRWEERVESMRYGGNGGMDAYYLREKDFYAKVLASGERNVKGPLKDLAEEYKVDPVEFAGILDGISESLEGTIDINELDEDSEVDITVDYKKLYYNMIKAKAKWLYGLGEWDALLTAEERKDIKARYIKDNTYFNEKIGRNDPCPCGSGRKYKKCCLAAAEAAMVSAAAMDSEADDDGPEDGDNGPGTVGAELGDENAGPDADGEGREEG